MNLGRLLHIIHSIPGAVGDLPSVSEPDFELVAEKLDRAANLVRLLGGLPERHLSEDRSVFDAVERERLRSTAPRQGKGGAIVRLP